MTTNKNYFDIGRAIVPDDELDSCLGFVSIEFYKDNIVLFKRDLKNNRAVWDLNSVADLHERLSKIIDEFKDGRE